MRNKGIDTNKGKKVEDDNLTSDGEEEDVNKEDLQTIVKDLKIWSIEFKTTMERRDSIELAWDIFSKFSNFLNICEIKMSKKYRK